MAQQTLAEWIKTGYPYLKAGTGLSSHVLPERGFGRVVDEAGDAGIMNVSHPLCLDIGKEMLRSAPDPATVPPQAWQDAVRDWPPLSQLGPVVAAFLEWGSPAMSQAINPDINPTTVCRGMAVLLFAPFVDQGRALLEELADILHGHAKDPAGLITSYAGVVRRSDIRTLEMVDRCIVKYDTWREWASALQEQVLRCQYTPRLVAITPPLSTELVDIMAALIKEERHGPSADNPGYTGDQVAA